MLTRRCSFHPHGNEIPARRMRETIQCQIKLGKTHWRLTWKYDYDTYAANVSLKIPISFSITKSTKSHDATIRRISRDGSLLIIRNFIRFVSVNILISRSGIMTNIVEAQSCLLFVKITLNLNEENVFVLYLWLWIVQMSVRFRVRHVDFIF